MTARMFGRQEEKRLSPKAEFSLASVVFVAAVFVVRAYGSLLTTTAA